MDASDKGEQGDAAKTPEDFTDVAGELPDDVIDLAAERYLRRPHSDDENERRPPKVTDPPNTMDEALQRLASALDITLDGTMPTLDEDDDED